MDAQKDEHDNSNQGECRLCRKNGKLSLFFGNLTKPAESPDKEKDQSDFVHLVVDHLVVLVDLKDKSIVNMVEPEYLDASASGKQDEHNNKSYYVHIKA